MRIVIVGAGPTGLGAAYRLQELAHEDFAVLESAPHAGGLAASYTDPEGFTWDVGGHVMFSHYDYYDDLFKRFMGDEFTVNDRESWVRIMDRWVPYPFQNNVRHLPKQATFECLQGLIHAQLVRKKNPLDAENFGEFIDLVFGSGIAKHFMRPYNFKVWAYPPEMMNKVWIGERVAVIDADRALKNVVLEQDDFGWGPNNRFKYPLKGGTGSFYKRIAESLESRIRYDAKVIAIDSKRRIVRLADGAEEPYDALITAMPIDVLLNDVVQDAPESIRATSSRLLHSAGHMVGIGIKRKCPSTKCWMYFPDDNCPFYRVTYLSNYSPYMTPNQTGDNDTHYSLLCETSESDCKPVDNDTIIEDTIKGLENSALLEPGERSDIVSTWYKRVEYSYPTPSVDRDDILSEVIPWLEDRGIYSRGRFGMWKYEVANTDHTLMQGVECVNRLLLDERETTIGIVYRTTDDGREAADHQRPAVAGSGEKRLKVEIPDRNPARTR